MKDSYSVIDLFLNATDLVNFEDFYVITFRPNETQFQGRYSPKLVLNISAVAARLVQDGHEVTNWEQSLDPDTGYVGIEFRLNGKRVEFTLT